MELNLCTLAELVSNCGLEGSETNLAMITSKVRFLIFSFHANKLWWWKTKINQKDHYIHHLQKPSDLFHTDDAPFQFCFMYTCYMSLFMWVWRNISCTHSDNAQQIIKSWLWQEILRKTMTAQRINVIRTALLSWWSIDFGSQKIKHTFRDFLTDLFSQNIVMEFQHSVTW
jgi:hypothetical protein